MISGNPYVDPPGLSADNPSHLQVMSPNRDISDSEQRNQQSAHNRLRELAGNHVDTPIPDDASIGSGDQSIFMDVHDRAVLAQSKRP